MPCEYLKRSGNMCESAAYRGGKLCMAHIGAIPYVRCAGPGCVKVVSTKHGRPLCTTCDRKSCAAASRAKTKADRQARKAAGIKAAADDLADVGASPPDLQRGMSAAPKQQEAAPAQGLPADQKAGGNPPALKLVRIAAADADEDDAESKHEATGSEPGSDEEFGYDLVPVHATFETPIGAYMYRIYLTVEDGGEVHSCTAEKSHAL